MAANVFTGIWDCLTNSQVVEFVRRGIAERQELHKICENLMDNCLAPSSDGGGYGCDNMTVIIVAILNGKTKEQWYDMVVERVANKDGPVAPKKFGTPPPKKPWAVAAVPPASTHSSSPASSGRY